MRFVTRSSTVTAAGRLLPDLLSARTRFERCRCAGAANVRYPANSAAQPTVRSWPNRAGTKNGRLLASGGSIDLGHIARGPVVLIKAVLADVETFARA